jgi:hypothetical protein
MTVADDDDCLLFVLAETTTSRRPDFLFYCSIEVDDDVTYDCSENDVERLHTHRRARVIYQTSRRQMTRRCAAPRRATSVFIFRFCNNR